MDRAAGPDAKLALDFDDPAVVQAFWEDLYPRLKMAIARRIRSLPCAVANESEIALSAIHCFINGVKQGQFDDLADQDAIWRLLKTIAIRKANDCRKHLTAQKRGGGRVILGQSDMAGESAAGLGVELAPGQEPAPSAGLEVAELLNGLLERLPDDRRRDVVLLKLQGASVPVIAECLGTTTRTVQRMLRQIESDWNALLLDD